MSRAHGLNWKICQKAVHTEDSSDLPITLVEILPPQEMIQILKDELAEEGWEGKEKTIGKAKAVLVEGPQGIKVKITASQTGNVDVEAPTQVEADAIGKQQEARLQTDQRSTVTAAILAAETEVTANIQTAMQRVLVTALKRKAATMGTIEGISESGSGADHEITIKVRV